LLIEAPRRMIYSRALRAVTFMVTSMPHQVEPIITLYPELPVACREYDPRAAQVAQHLAQIIASHLPAVMVEHVGSTAVPGCAGKGIVDVMILYPPGQLEEVKALLDALGFQRQKTRDPFPEDRPMRRGAIEREGTLFRLHAHVLASDSPEVTDFRRFRDQLRADPELMAAYIQRKRAIIESGVTDSIDYCERKGSFVTAVLEALH